MGEVEQKKEALKKHFSFSPICRIRRKYFQEEPKF